MKEILNKLKFKAYGVVLNAPDTIAKKFVEERMNTLLPKVDREAYTLIFVRSRKEVTKAFQLYDKKIQFDSVFWLAYPKQSMHIKSDINRDIIRTIAGDFCLSTVTAISIDDTWSALRFRPSQKVGT